MDRNVIDQVSQEQVKSKECRRQKEVVHRMQLNAAHCRDDQHQKEKEEQRDRSEETNSPRQRSWLQMLRHGHRDLVPGNQVAEFPIQDPAISGFVLFSRRERVVGKIDVLEVGCHQKREVFYLSHIWRGLAIFIFRLADKTVSPIVQTLR